MTSDQRVYQCVKATGIPGTKLAYPEGDAPAAPFFVYEVDDFGETFADDGNWASTPRYRVELLERYGDAELETEVFDALRAEFGPVKVYEDWDTEDHCKVTSYYFTITD